jgi:hypothetical protein
MNFQQYAEIFQSVRGNHALDPYLRRALHYGSHINLLPTTWINDGIAARPLKAHAHSRTHARTQAYLNVLFNEILLLLSESALANVADKC